MEKNQFHQDQVPIFLNRQWKGYEAAKVGVIGIALVMQSLVVWRNLIKEDWLGFHPIHLRETILINFTAVFTLEATTIFTAVGQIQ